MGGRSAGEARFGGLPGNRAIGSNTYASRSSVTAVIHDLDPDDQILPRQNRSDIARRRPVDTVPLGSVTELRRARQAAVALEAKSNFERALKAESAGKLSMAKTYFELATKTEDKDLKARARARAAAVAKAMQAARDRSFTTR
jgi:hypothetical protein